MSRSVKRAASLLGAAALAVLGVASAHSAQGRPPLVEGPLAFEAPEGGAACSWSGREDDAPLPVVAGVTSLQDPEEIDRLLECAGRRNLEVIARLEPPVEWQRAADPYAALAPWIADLERFVQARRGRIRVFVLGERPDERFDPVAWAFLLEKAGTALRSIDPEAALVAGPIGDLSASWFETLPPSRIAPYIAGISLRDPVDLGAWIPRIASADPAVAVWLQMQPETAAGALGRIQAARAAGVRTVIVPAGPVAVRDLLIDLAAEIPSRFVVDPAPPAVPGPGGNPPLMALADPLGPERAFVIDGAGGARITIAAEPSSVRSLRAIDLASGADVEVKAASEGAGEEAAGEGQAAGAVAGGGATEIEVGPAAGPVLLRFLLVKGPRAEPETVGVTAGYDLTAEEIIALQRAFDATQARDLQHYTAKATLSYHYRVDVLNETVDVASLNRFFWKEGTGEYEETDLFINGARWRGPAPALPFIEPEKIKEVPIEIRLDASLI